MATPVNADQGLIKKWDTIQHGLTYPPEEFIRLIDGIDFVMLCGVPDGKDLPILAKFVGAIRKMCGLDYIGARQILEDILKDLPEDNPIHDEWSVEITLPGETN